MAGGVEQPTAASLAVSVLDIDLYDQTKLEKFKCTIFWGGQEE
jgi:hypothetical protein